MYVCVCVFVCSGIPLERVERFRPNLVLIWLYVCVRILCIYYIYIFYLLSINLREGMMWEASMGYPPHVTNRYRGNA
jgi:hypothetical protein